MGPIERVTVRGEKPQGSEYQGQKIVYYLYAIKALSLTYRLAVRIS